MGVVTFLLTHPPALWLAVAAVLLAIEVATGTGWLLWASGAAGVVCLLSLAAPLGLPWQLVVFAVLTIVAGLLGRRFLPRGFGQGADINDNAARLVGRQARVVTAFEAGRGRVAIDGKEWAAVLEAGEPQPVGASVEVISASGGELRVRSA